MSCITGRYLAWFTISRQNETKSSQWVAVADGFPLLRGARGVAKTARG